MAAAASNTHARIATNGITAAELVLRVPHRRTSGRLGAGELERWLLDGNLARLEHGLLVPTERACELAEGLGQLHWA